MKRVLVYMHSGDIIERMHINHSRIKMFCKRCRCFYGDILRVEVEDDKPAGNNRHRQRCRATFATRFIG